MLQDPPGARHRHSQVAHTYYSPSYQKPRRTTLIAIQAPVGEKGRRERGPFPGAPELESAQETEPNTTCTPSHASIYRKAPLLPGPGHFHRQVVSHVLEDMQNPTGFPEGTLALEPEGSVFKFQFCLLPAV